jgi:DNA-binding CsgD family transcriptional regulator
MKKSTKKSLLYQKGFALTETESEVLSLITEEFLTPKQIQIARDCSKQAFYKIRRNLIKKGAINSGNQKVYFEGGSSQPSHQRLHGQQFRIRLISKSIKYQEILNKSNMIQIDGNTIRLYKDILEIYSNKSFFGANEQEATYKSLIYWKSFIVGLENEFGVILQKPRTQNIKIVKQHYAETNSQLAKESQKSGKEIKVYSKDDGKLAVIMDNSFNLNERECIHPSHNKIHSEAITKQVSDFIENNPPTNSELANFIKESAIQIRDITNNQLIFDKNMSSHLKVLNKIGDAINKLNKRLSQTKLSEYL